MNVISSFRSASNSVDAPLPVNVCWRACSLTLARRDVPNDLLPHEALQAAGDLGLALPLGRTSPHAALPGPPVSALRLQRKAAAISQARCHVARSCPSTLGTDKPLARI